MKKKIISVLSTFLCIIGMSAQVPGSFQYQAVLRNDDGSIASNKPLEVRVRIHQGAADGTVVYEEDHTTSSNASGIITLKVGEGVNTSRETLFGRRRLERRRLFLRNAGQPGYRLRIAGNPAVAERAVCQMCGDRRQRACEIARREIVENQSK